MFSLVRNVIALVSYISLRDLLYSC